MKSTPYNGLYVAAYTPMDDLGNVNLDAVPALVEHNLKSGISGFYICGTTGEGMSLTTSERIDLAEAFIKAVDRRAPVIIQVGHNCLRDAAVMAEAAAEAGADGISAHVPTYYRVSDVEMAVQCSAEVAKAAPDHPFFYYHIPPFTGCHISMRDYSLEAMDKIPNFKGLKFSDTRVDFLKAAMEVCPEDYGFFFGCDEMLMAGLTHGVPAAVGSTYNVFAPQFLSMMEALSSGDLELASRRQAECSKLISAVARYPFHAAMKALLSRLGAPCGTTRPPNRPISSAQTDELIKELADLGCIIPPQ